MSSSLPNETEGSFFSWISADPIKVPVRSGDKIFLYSADFIRSFQTFQTFLILSQSTKLLRGEVGFCSNENNL